MPNLVSVFAMICFVFFLACGSNRLQPIVDSRDSSPSLVNHSRDPNYPYITGDGFRAYADYIFDETGTSLLPENVRFGDIIFVKTDVLADFVNNLHPKINNAYILVTHNADHPAPGEFEKLLNDPKLIAWFAQNTEITHPKLHSIPIGFANRYITHQSIDPLIEARKLLMPNQERDILLYMNFQKSTSPNERGRVYDKFIKNPFCVNRHSLSRPEYFKDLSKAKFVLSPRGNGLDTHRTWEALLMGAIPIVKTSAMDPVFEDLPVLIVNDWQEVTEDFLSGKWQELKIKTFKPERLLMKYWLNKISLTAVEAYRKEISAQASNLSLVFVHIGDRFPDYLGDALAQARLFNPNAEIVVLGNLEAINQKIINQEMNVNFIPIENLRKSDTHQNFLKFSVLDNKFRGGFWRAASERFFYIDDYMQQFNKKNVIHMENDGMLYADLTGLLPVLQKKYNYVAATFDNDERVIPLFMYFKDRLSSRLISKEFLYYSMSGKNDMEVLASMKTDGSPWIEALPVVPDTYTVHSPLRSTSGKVSEQPHSYSNNFADFNSIFDAAAYGQYLGGIDPRNEPGKRTVRFINESSLYDPSRFTYEWLQDEMSRYIPYANIGGMRTRLNVLHIHSKNLRNFSSRRGEAPWLL